MSQHTFAYSCEMCSYAGPGMDASDEAWGDGVAHFTNTGHEHGKVVEFDGQGYEHNHHPHNHHHGNPPIHIF